MWRCLGSLVVLGSLYGIPTACAVENGGDDAREAGGRKKEPTETIVPLVPLLTSAGTGEKPQSKVWFHAGTWWAVLPSKSVSPPGTWLWRLESDNSWSQHLHLSAATDTRADTRARGEVAHIFLHGRDPALVSVEYVRETNSYKLWTARPAPTSIFLPRSEVATIDIDSAQRLWLATTRRSQVVVYYSDSPYSFFSGPVVLAEGIAHDDISAITALPDRTVGVLWSNQRTKRFGFRVHADGSNPKNWRTDEVPGAPSAIENESGMADDHLNLAVSSDGTLYAAVKTSYSRADAPRVGLLVRRPGGKWDDLHEVDRFGGRAIALLNEYTQTLRVIYTVKESSNPVVFRETPLSPISFGPRQTLLRGLLNDVTSTRETWTDQVVILASRESGVPAESWGVRGIRIHVPIPEKALPLWIWTALIVIPVFVSLFLWRFYSRHAK